MSYLYETHLHTCYGSACGHSTGKEHVRYYKSIGYTGIFITDHFWRGNARPDRSLPWREWVNQYCSGYEDALEEGYKLGLDVFFGWEETIQGDDYLIYGLDRQFLLDHPESRYWTYREQYEQVHAHGGCVVQAHPFRERDYIKCIHLNPMVDAVEIANAGNEPYQDIWAKHYAEERGFYKTAGSDNHLSVQGIREQGRVYGMALPEKLTCAADYVRLILEKRPSEPVYAEGRHDEKAWKPLTLPVDEIENTLGK